MVDSGRGALGTFMLLLDIAIVNVACRISSRR
jgi:hypothetical protein